jgi:hypothetical protein
MADEIKHSCSCARCRRGALIGPVLLITVGAIFLLGRFTDCGFERLWPVIMLVAGGLILAQSSASRAGHTGAQ